MLITLCLYPIPILVFFPISFSPVPLPTCDFQGFGHISNRRWRRDMRRPLDLRPWKVSIGKPTALESPSLRRVLSAAKPLLGRRVAGHCQALAGRRLAAGVGLAVANRRLPLQLKKKPKIMQQHLDEDDDNDDGQSHQYAHSNRRKKSVEEIKHEADRVFEILQQDGPGFSVPSALDQLQLKVSNSLIREVLLRILVMLNNANSLRCAKLAYKFFVWSGQQPGHKHNSNSYNLIMKVFSEAKELKAMCRLADEMTDKGLPITACTAKQNITVYACDCSEEVLRKAKEMIATGSAISLVPRFFTFLLDVSVNDFPDWLFCTSCRRNSSPEPANFSSDSRGENLEMSHMSAFLREDQCCIGGVDFVTMIDRLPPSLAETLCSLNFASRVRGIEHGPLRKQTDLGEFQA
ncbi:hypothetical protein ZIOFF_069959 [Zingiber officinale]|uniref:Pentatricopeptide repeat-containing protein n=1 Tax=Zingiber officinale TaxID=94328 RepID=A0A8J5C4V5_ZINOF|nr:hypothetical protein ZIOFF_069959 [Zingiber officinale]